MRRHILSIIIVLTTGLALPGFARPAAAGEWDFGLEVAGELRVFPYDPAFADQLERLQPSLTVQPDLRWETQNRRHQLVLIPFFRWDGRDDERTHFDIREGYYRFNGDSFSLTVGAAKVFWGKTESRHLVDIINQTDGVEDIDEEDKLGQPMVNLTLIRDFGTLDFFVLPGFRRRTFPGSDGRLRFDPAVDRSASIFERDAGRGAVDFAARYSHFIGNWDFGLSVFHGTGREPRFALPLLSDPVPLDDGTLFQTPITGIRPVYDRITQGSLDLQYTKDAWLWKAEALIREGQGDTFFASVVGFEYTLYKFFGSNMDLGLLTEYQYDGRDDIDEVVLEDFGPALAAPVTPADNDVFIGARLGFNDVQDTALLAGTTIDVDDQSMGMFIEGERRLGQNWTAELEARLFINIDRGNLLDVFRDDDFVTFRLTRYF